MAKLKILVVDDAAFIRDLVKKAVKETYPGCDLFEAIDGLQGYQYDEQSGDQPGAV